MVNGRFKYQGGILITAIFTIGLLSALLMFLIGNYRNALEFSTRTRRYYEMRIMTELFLQDYSQVPAEKNMKGEVYYNTGKISYSVQENRLIVTAYAGKYQQTYQEVLKESDTENVGNNTESERKEEGNANKEITDESLE
jgi:O-glycosyl hydrolase